MAQDSALESNLGYALKPGGLAALGASQDNLWMRVRAHLSAQAFASSLGFLPPEFFY
jgi:hypothetical protein